MVGEVHWQTNYYGRCLRRNLERPNSNVPRGNAKRARTSIGWIGKYAGHANVFGKTWKRQRGELRRTAAR